LFNATTYNCDINLAANTVANLLFKPCKNDSDCGGKAGLACDTSPLGMQTYTCKVEYGRSCVVGPNECVDNLMCSSQINCICVSKIKNSLLSKINF